MVYSISTDLNRYWYEGLSLCQNLLYTNHLTEKISINAFHFQARPTFDERKLRFALTTCIIEQ